MTNLSFFFQAEDGIRDAQESRGLGDVYKRQLLYGAVSADALANPGVSEFLTLGGDNGLRGYPLRLSLIHI